MLANGQYVDGSWLLTIYVDELDVERQIRVQGDWSVGQVLAQLIQDLPPPILKPNKSNEVSLRYGAVRTGWCEHCLWWPAKCKWLFHSRLSLNQYGLQADALLRFVPIYGRLRVQLPDLQIRNFVEVNYTDPVFRVTMSICRHLNIRHPEELSLSHPLSPSDLKSSRIIGGVVDRRQHTADTINKRSTFQRSATISTTHTHTKDAAVKLVSASTENKENDENEPKVNGVTRRSSNTSHRLFGPPCIRDKRTSVRVSTAWNPNFKHALALSNSTLYPGSISTLAFEFRSIEDPSLASSPLIGLEEACAKCFIVHPLSFAHRLRLNGNWLDSSKSLMEQGIDVIVAKYNTQSNSNEANDAKLKIDQVDCPDEAEPPLLLLRFKYGSYYDLNQKYDAVRINQLYEQAKWSVISEQIETTDDEACLLAALQAHVEIASEREEKEVTAPFSITYVDGQKKQENGTNKPINTDTHLRDTSPLGGYLRHQQDPRLTKSRPVSIIELDSQIDAMLDELSTIDGADVTSIGGYHRSRSRQKRTPRPLSLTGNSVTEPTVDQDPPQLRDYVKVCKPRKFGLKMFRRLFIVADGLKLLVFRNKDDYDAKMEPSEVVYLPGCEVQPDLCMVSNRFNIRVFVPVSRTNLPISAAFNLGSLDDNRGQDEEIGIGGRLKRRASLLSLTSLSHFGLQSSAGPNGLCGASAAVLGLVNEIIFRFSDAEAYTDWLALLRLATAVPSFNLSPGEDQADFDFLLRPAEWTSIVNRSTYEAERKAIASLIRLISVSSTGVDQVDSNLQATSLHTRLENRFTDFLPMRLSGTKSLFRTSDSRARDQLDSTTQKIATLPSDSKPPVSPLSTSISNMQKTNLCRRISIAYSRIHELTSMQAKLKYISAWEQMPNHGIAFFPARIEVTLPLSSLIGNDQTGHVNSKSGVPWMNRPLGGNNVTVSSSRRVEAVGIGPTRIFRCDVQTGEIIASWRLSSIHGWHINWELGELILLLSPPPPPNLKEDQRSASPPPAVKESAGRVIIRPLGVPVRTVAEFLGGYTFLNLRAPDKNQGLDEGVFYKLTTGSAFPMSHNIGPHHYSG